MSTGTERPRTGGAVPGWTVRGLVASHRAAAVGAAILCVAMVALIAAAALGPRAGAVTDATSCSQWGSANKDQQNAFARLYVSEHGQVHGWGAGPAGVINAINAGCYQAYGEGVEDSATVIQAISRNF